MSESSTSPFMMVGVQNAAVCVDGVCELPPAQDSLISQSHVGATRPNEQANDRAAQQSFSAHTPQV